MKNEERKKKEREKKEKMKSGDVYRWERGHTWEAEENLYGWTYSCVCENVAIANL